MAPYYYRDCWWAGATAFEIWFNLEFWNDELSRRQRRAIRSAAKISVLANLAQTVPKQQAVIDRLVPEENQLASWPEQSLTDIKSAAFGLNGKYEEWREADTIFAEIYDSMVAYLDTADERDDDDSGWDDDDSR